MTQPVPTPEQPTPMYAQPAQPAPTKNTLGLIALIVAILGLILSFVKGALIAGWVLLPIGFILGIVSLFMKNKKKGMGIAAIVVSVVGAIVAPVMFLAYIGDAADEALNAPPAQTGPDGKTIENKGKDAQGTSRENPLPVGSSVESKEWSYTINSVDLNATDAVLAENPFNDAPSDGQQYNPDQRHRHLHRQRPRRRHPIRLGCVRLRRRQHVRRPRQPRRRPRRLRPDHHAVRRCKHHRQHCYRGAFGRHRERCAGGLARYVLRKVLRGGAVVSFLGSPPGCW